MDVFQNIILINSNTNDSKKIPDWLLIFGKGENELADGRRYIVDEIAFNIVYAEFKKRGVDLVVDYEHASLKDKPNPAAGWIKDLRWNAQKGIEAKIVWTEKAKEFLLNKEYRYFSPSFCVRKSDKRLVSLVNVALTHMPLHNNLKPLISKKIINKENDMNLEEVLKELGLNEDASFSDVEACVSKFKDDAVISKAVFKELDLKETATLDDCKNAVTKLKESKQKEVISAKVLDALDLKETATESEVIATIYAAKNSSGSVSIEEFKKLQAKIEAKEADDLVKTGMNEGKITAAQKTWALEYAKKDKEGFEIYLSKAAVVVPLNKLPGGSKANEQEKDAATLQVAKMMQVSKEDIEKYSKKEKE